MRTLALLLLFTALYGMRVSARAAVNDSATFLSIPWGATAEQVRSTMLAQHGVTIDAKRSTDRHLVFRGLEWKGFRTDSVVVGLGDYGFARVDLYLRQRGTTRSWRAVGQKLTAMFGTPSRTLLAKDEHNPNDPRLGICWRFKSEFRKDNRISLDLTRSNQLKVCYACPALVGTARAAATQ